MTHTRPKAWLLACALTMALLAALIPTRVSAASEYDAEGATKFVFSDSGIIVTEGSYTGYKSDDTALTINGAGTYVVSGSCADGSIKIKKGTTGVTLVLNGLTLTSSDTAPIACNKSTEVTIVAASGTTNTLTDSAKNNDETYTDNTNAENAVIKCKDGSTVTLCGSGTLNIVANGKNGIKSGAATDEEGDASLTIRDLTLNITANVNDAINAEQLLNIESGTLTISAADDAIHCDYELNIGAKGTSGPTINIKECYEGIEAAELNVLSGNIDINSTDDCMNAANSDLTGYDFVINISGGTISAYASEGDGFDSNGDLNISGGTVAVWTANSADNQPLDADGTLNVTGGTVLAAGGSNGMGVPVTATQPYVSFGSTGGMGGGQTGGNRGGALLSKNSAFSVKDSSGKTVYSGTAVCNAGYLFFSSDELTSGDSYSLYSGSASVSTATAQTGTATGGFPGGMGGGQQPGSANGQTPPTRPDGESGTAAPDDMTPPDGQTPPARPDGENEMTFPDGQTPPTKPDGENGAASPDGMTPPGGFDGQQPPAMPNGQQPSQNGTAAAGNGTFRDVTEDSWCYDAVEYAYEKNLMTGVSADTFAPNGTCTRAQLVTILYRLAGSPSADSASFSDVTAGTWYTDAVAWASANSIVTGYADGSFAPNEAVTREQLAAILYRYAQSAQLDTSATASLSGFTDSGAVSGYAGTAMAWANAEGLITGADGNTLLPKASATRAQVATILMRFLENA